MIKIDPITVKKMFQSMNLPQLHQILNLWAVEENTIIGTDLAFSRMFEIVQPDLTYCPISESAGFMDAIKNSLDCVPENITIQLLVRGRKGDDELINRYLKTVEPKTELEKQIINDKVCFLKHSNLQRVKYYLFITTYPEKTDLAKFKAKMFRMFSPDYKTVTKTMHHIRMNAIEDLSERIIRSFQSCGIEMRQREEKEIIDFIYGVLNPSRSKQIPMSPIDPQRTLRSQIVYNACENQFDHTWIDGTYFRATNLHFRPKSAHIFSLSQFIKSLPVDYDLIFTFNTIEQEKIIKKIQFNETIGKAAASLNPFTVNREALILAQDANQIINDVKTNYQKFYSYSLCVIAQDHTLKKLTAKTDQIAEAFKTIGEAEGIIDDMNHLPLLLTSIPGHQHLNVRKHPIQSEALCHMIPVSAPWTGCKNPKLLFKTPEEQIIPFDLFDSALAAKHGIIMGGSGAGKSFTCNYLLTNFLIESEKNHIVIIDVGGSYKKLANIFSDESQYLEVELSEKFAFNPFPLKSAAFKQNENGETELDPDVISYLTLLVQKMLNLKELSGRESSIIEKTVIETYKNTPLDPPILGIFRDQLKNYKGDQKDIETAMEFYKNLEMWTDRRYGKILNCQQSISINARLVIFDLQKLEDQPDLQAIIFFVIKNVIQSKLKNLSLQKIIVIDEGWKFFNDEIGSKLIIDLYRTARKFNGAIYSISQKPSDFLKTAAAGSIISNSYVRYFLKLNNEFELLPQFELTDEEIETIKQLQVLPGIYSEMFLKFNRLGRVVRIEPSQADYWICSTDDTSTTLLQRLKADYPNLKQSELFDLVLKNMRKVQVENPDFTHSQVLKYILKMESIQ